MTDPSPPAGPAPAPARAAAPNGAVTVRGLPPALKSRLRVRAAHNGRSMEAEARAILEAALAAPEEDPADLAAFARALFAPLGGLDVDPLPRDAGAGAFAEAAGEEPTPSSDPPRGPARRKKKTMASPRSKPAAKGRGR